MSQYLLLKNDGEPDNSNVALTSTNEYEGGVLGGGSFSATIDTENRLSSVRWYDTSTLYNNENHPENPEEFWAFFQEERDDVSFGGIELEWDQDLAWGTRGRPKPSYLPADGFSFHFTGEIYAPESGTYQFGVDGDDAVDLYIDDQRVVGWYGGHGTNGSFSAHSGSITLSEGWHSIISRHEEGGGGEAWAVGWNKPSDSGFSVIPNSSYRSPDQSRLGAETSTQSFTTTDASSSDPVVTPQSSTLTDQLGNAFSTTTLSGVSTLENIDSTEGNIQSSTFTNAFEETVTSTQFGNSSSTTFTNGDVSLFSHSDRPANLTTSSAVNANIESFDTVQRTAIGDALSTVIGEETTVTALGSDSISDALTTPLAAAQTTTATVQDGQSFGDVYAQLVAANAPLSPTFGTGTTAVTSLGDAEVSVASPQFDNALVELFAFVSPTDATGSGTIGSADTSTAVTALTENAFAITLSPTLDIVVAVKKGEVGLESAFADSLSANVGTQTSIKVAKTIANADDLGGVFDTATFADGIASIGELTANESTMTTSASVDALVVAAALNAFSSSTTQTTGSGTRTQSVGESTLGVGDSLATSDGAVIKTVTSIVDADSVSSANPDALKEAAETLLADGVVETKTDAAAVVATVVARRQRGTVDTQTGVSGIAETFVTTNRVGRATSSATGSGGVSLFTSNTIDSGVIASALSVLTAITQSATPIGATPTTSATTVGETTGSLFSPQVALLSLLFGSVSGSNSATVETIQRTRLFNTNNSVRIINT